jgi:spermidine synthase
MTTKWGKKGAWVQESLKDGEVLIKQETRKILCKKRSQFQKIVVAEVKNLRYASGRALLLDGHIQLHEADEFIYHEQLVMPPLFYHPSPKNVMVIGGGDGFAIDYIFRDKRVEHALLCELDGDVVEVSKEYFGDLNHGSLEHPGLEIALGDCRDTLKTLERSYDVILLDLTDVSDFPELHTLYEEIFDLLAPVSNQGTIVNVFCAEVLADTCFPLQAINFLSKIFPHVHFHRMFVGYFNQECGFAFASHTNYVEETSVEQIRHNAQSFAPTLKSLRCENFPAAFQMPPYLEAELQNICLEGSQAS